MPESKALQERIAALFSEKLSLDVPSADTDLIETGILDSLKFVELLAHLEQQFATQISTDDLEIDNFRCIEKIAQFIASRNQHWKGTPA